MLRPAKTYPTRTCVACRTSRQKREFVRIVRTPDGAVILDASGRAAGRGAYLCADGACWQVALDKHVLQRALEVPLPQEVRQALQLKIQTGASAARPEGQSEGESIGQK